MYFLSPLQNAMFLLSAWDWKDLCECSRPPGTRRERETDTEDTCAPGVGDGVCLRVNEQDAKGENSEDKETGSRML